MSHDTIAEIFRKIGTKDTNREGLNDLYDMKLANPGIDLEPFLVNSTSFFKNYIENGLKSIEAERRGGGGGGGSASATPPTSRSLEHLQQQTTSRSGSSQSLVDGLASSGSSAMTTPDQEGGGGGGGGGTTNTSFYMERLKVLRAKCGLDNPRVPPVGGGGAATMPSNEKDLGFEKICSSSSLNVDETNNGLSSYGGGGGSGHFGTISLGTSHKMGTTRPVIEPLGGGGGGDGDSAALPGGESNKDVEDLKRRLEMIKSKRKM